MPSAAILQFAQFYRSLEAYKQSFASKGDVLVVDPSSDFFKGDAQQQRRAGCAAEPWDAWVLLLRSSDSRARHVRHAFWPALALVLIDRGPAALLAPGCGAAMLHGHADAACATGSCASSA
jgi:hypothetical protein